MKNLKQLFICACVAACTVATSARAAPILVGAATFNTANDLTRIRDGGVTYEFLDLTSTLDMTATTALATFGPARFALATSVDMTRLLAGFGIAYASTSDNYATLPITQANAVSFVDYLGNTNGSKAAALGSFEDVDHGMGYACIGWNVCTASAFIRDVDASTAPRWNFGTYLVRIADDSSSVPEPASPALLGLGAALIALARPRPGSSNPPRRRGRRHA